MKINTKVRYGLRAMIELAMHDNEHGLLQKEICERQKIPGKYFDKIVTGLKTSGLIVNKRGKRSGYVLAKPAERISVYEIYRAFEPELSILQCITTSGICIREDFCAGREFWERLNIEIEAIMVNETLDTLAAIQKENDLKQSAVFSFEI